ncbi:hypothetical protein FQU85_01120 [Salarchaeum sp. JOR-1]|nr:hypothetical protein [Salarchaeum sp. JOR-1]QDX39555.1 hypothetical protein FQU85_01120 [Salarchaeum sp. JOR-1]
MLLVWSDRFAYGGGTVEPGETYHGRYAISETFLGESIRVPLTVVNGERVTPDWRRIVDATVETADAVRASDPPVTPDA